MFASELSRQLHGVRLGRVLHSWGRVRLHLAARQRVPMTTPEWRERFHSMGAAKLARFVREVTLLVVRDAMCLKCGQLGVDVVAVRAGFVCLLCIGDMARSQKRPCPCCDRPFADAALPPNDESR
jgi:hypothetical protein